MTAVISLQMTEALFRRASYLSVKACFYVHRCPAVRVEIYPDSRVSDTHPPLPVVHLLEVKPLIDDQFIESALIFKFYGMRGRVRQDTPTNTL